METQIPCLSLQRLTSLPIDLDTIPHKVINKESKKLLKRLLSKSAHPRIGKSAVRLTSPTAEPTLITSQQLLQSSILDYASESLIGCTNNSLKQVNQDAFTVSFETYALFAVFDGHGKYGHSISNFVKAVLPLHITQALQVTNNQLKTALSQAFYVTKTELKQTLPVESHSSGSTALVVLFTGEKIVCANLGDSRVVLAKQLPDGRYHAAALTADHKPSQLTEKLRIEERGGEIRPFSLPDGKCIGAPRIWFPHKEGPGLAMTRCFGNHIAESIGIRSVPEVCERQVKSGDKFVIVATDGLWDVLSSQESIQIASQLLEQGLSPQNTCKALAEAARKRWGNRIDDITIILVVIKPK